MQDTISNPDLHDTIQRRAKELFQEHQQGIFKSTDRLFAGLMLAQWIAAIVASLVISPKTWEGGHSEVHIHVWAAILVGGIVSVFPVFLAMAYPGRAITRYTIASAQMLMSGLLIHLTGGRIETHFHIFGSLAFLAFYRDWRVLIPATIVTGLDHFLRGALWPQSIYGVMAASSWRTLEHVGWVVFEDVFLIAASIRSVREMKAIAWHTAQLETTNQVIEQKVEERTAEVKASEERFRLLMDGVQDYAIIMLDPQGNIVSWNEGARRVNGYQSDEILGKHFSILHPEADRLAGKPDSDLEQAATLGRLEDEGWRIRQDGSTFWANAVFTALYDDSGALRGFSKVTRDITVRRQAEETLLQAKDDLERRVEVRTKELAEANKALQAEIAEHQRDEADIRLKNTLLEAQGEAAIEGILVVSATGVIASHNQRFADMWDIPTDKLTGHSSQHALQASMGKLVDPADFESNVMALRGNDTDRIQDQLLLKNGSTYDYYSAPLKGKDGMYYGRIWFFRDVTDAKKAAEALNVAKEDAEKANAAKSEFLSRMSHELRTPMNAILGFGQLLEWDILTSDQSESVGQILKGGRHLLGLINEVLEISRIEAGHMSLSLEPVSLQTVLQEALDLVSPLAAQRSILLSSDGVGNCGQIVMADQQRLKQVILNLLSNAIKYNREGGKVTISCEKRDSAKFRLRIADTGHGIATEHLEKVFVPFERLGAEHTEIEGNGIGLSLSRQLMTLMGGEIGVTSELGIGSVFWIDLKMGQEAFVQHDAEENLAFDISKIGQPDAKPTILYIEDNLSNLRLVETILQRHFHIELLSAMQGSLGLQLAREHRPDLILLDLHLPDIMGDKVLAQLQGDAATEKIPVVMLSADATERQVERLLEAGANAYLTKPIDVKQFLTVLQNNLRDKSPIKAS